MTAGSVPAPNPRSYKAPQMTDYERNASHYEFRDPAGKGWEKRKEIRRLSVVLTTLYFALDSAKPRLASEASGS